MRTAGPNPPTIPDAVAHHRAGRIDAAEGIYRAILKDQPNHAEALHLLGGICLERGELDAANELIGHALEQDPMNPAYNCNFATVLMEKGETGNAIDYYRKALALQPDYVDAHFNLGNALGTSGNGGNAAEHYRRVLDLQPGHIPARNSLALVLFEADRFDEAVAELETALRIDPGSTESHANLALMLQTAGRIEDALARYDEALRHAPDDAEIRNNYGAALALAGRTAEAEREYLAALRLEPRLPDAHLNIGNLRRAERNIEAAETSYRRAIACAPDYAPAYNNLGAVLSAACRYSEADAALEHALRLRPHYVYAYNNLALARTRAGRFDQAIGFYEKALALSPNDQEFRSARASAELMIGRFASGWRSYLARPSRTFAPADLRQQPLPGDLVNKRILVFRDQGLGDEIFFARFLAQLKARGAEISYRAEPRLVSLFQRADIASHVDGGDIDGDFDFRISVGDLPYLLGMNSRDQIPPSIRLEALQERETALADRLGEFGPPPYIGVTWRAGIPNTRNILYKESPMMRQAAALAPLDARIIVLQRAPEKDEVAGFSDALGRPVCDLAALNSDLEDMLALVGLLDDYVCVSNTNVHLAAARDRTCRVLIPNPPEFRWMATGNESPWFPGMKLYRQATDGDWSAAFEALTRDIAIAFPHG